MLRKKNIITIDGPSGTGKSSVAKTVALKLNYLYLDTGSMYRAVTLAALDNGYKLDPPDENGINSLLAQNCLTLDEDGRVLLFGKPVDHRIRSDAVTRAVSGVAALVQVRSHLVRLQRAFAEKENVVAEGRDLGSVVYPEAAFKFYLDASPEERARRRAKQVSRGLQAGSGESSQGMDENAVLADQNRRDHMDSSRNCSPLMETEDMIRIDTTDMTEQEVQDLIIQQVRKGFS
ncbi:MAG: (d)CMP kinase [Planctomycetota bacterium]